MAATTVSDRCTTDSCYNGYRGSYKREQWTTRCHEGMCYVTVDSSYCGCDDPGHVYSEYTTTYM